uniref:Dachshund n=1 Tax=Terebratalia transversa TaxID=34513 RepID=A0A0D4RCE5_TERTR|nr:dachshund [Terebratalia transversa]
MEPSVAVVSQRSQISPTMVRGLSSAPTMVSTSSQLLYKLERPVYNSPPPVSNNPENNICKMIEYRGAKIAAFTVDGRELICLPQAFDLFLKHLVGGLHTVYTKLKRLDITPIVCNVEQVRVLRGLGAIQPGVNRCKLISPKEFDVLYEDCTNSSARPGRPPKRSNFHCASPDTLQRLKKSRLDNGVYAFPDDKPAPLISSGYSPYPPHLAMFPFMPYGHPLAHPAVSMAMANQFATLPHDKLFFNRDRTVSEAEFMSPRSKEEGLETSSNHSNHSVAKYKEEDEHKISDCNPIQVHSNSGELDLSLPKQSKASLSDSEESAVQNGCGSPEIEESEKDEVFFPHPIYDGKTTTLAHDQEKITVDNNSLAGSQATNENTGISSIDTLLQNIQGLLKVASENARHHQHQVNVEKAEMKTELLKERELRETIEKQLQEYQRTIAILQKKWKKEKKSRKLLQEKLDCEVKDTSKNGETFVSANTLRNHRMSSSDSKSNDEKISSPRMEKGKYAHDKSPGVMVPSMLGGYLQTSCAPNNPFLHSQIMKNEAVM